MKKLFLVLISLVTLNVKSNVLNDDDNRETYFEYVDSNSRAGLNLNQAKLRAIELITEAIPKLDEFDQYDSRRIINSLTDTIFRYAKNKISLSLCQELSKVTMFVNNTIRNQIFICPDDTWRNLKRKNVSNIDVIAQTIIHEGVHLIGVPSECRATIYELTIMKNTEINVQDTSSRDNYEDQCDFPERIY